MGVLLFTTLGWMAVLMLLAAWRNPRRPDLGPEPGSTLEAFLVHFALYAILGILVSYNVYYMKRRRQVLLGAMAALLAGLIWGSATEWYQLYVPERDGSYVDVLANTLGAICGGFLAVGVYRLIRFPGYRSRSIGSVP